jgi:hypothetical protein
MHLDIHFKQRMAPILIFHGIIYCLSKPSNAIRRKVLTVMN